ncbi:hypothetical protein BABINDRAFT_163380 [Babjeviella inositovora NRRL Y-12698]|uniref:Ribosomal lysine N-methyltransferase 5 n=1 Tax=Babjeviella inositovora NRRL Y-12698 TaxID=984486 RepID=A0A1E3QIZ4_9ASCO|nr:uncharacterized protein BABINDRAFT_163380 [Babjeviella inositovora NRRL Y-12698]ODQ77665.1 hypothetical protein BABINDRAFT_163380 [Babjeviella inositovora NRRL Y-12698]
MLKDYIDYSGLACLSLPQEVGHDISDVVANHIMDLYSSNQPEDLGLGFISPREKQLHLALGPDFELEIDQSPSLLASSSSNSNSNPRNPSNSTTGFVCWKTSPLLVQWLLYSEICPFKTLFFLRPEKAKLKSVKSRQNRKATNTKFIDVSLDQPRITIVELGSGVSGILGSTIGTLPSTLHFIATDHQQSILKLLRSNIQQNVTGRYTSTTMETKVIPEKARSAPGSGVSAIDVVEYDWEDDSVDPVHEIKDTLLQGQFPDLIMACDTIYNEYLIPFFTDSLLRLMGGTTVAILALQLRDSDMVEAFVNCLVEKGGEAGVEVYYVKDEFLSDELKRGFVVYYLERKEVDQDAL